MSARPLPALARVISRLLLVLGILAALPFLPAGRWDWPQAWALILPFHLSSAVSHIWPGLLTYPGALPLGG
jgi:hypothetical protein